MPFGAPTSSDVASRRLPTSPASEPGWERTTKHENMRIYIDIQGGDDRRNGSAGEAMTWEKVTTSANEAVWYKAGQ